MTIRQIRLALSCACYADPRQEITFFFFFFFLLPHPPASMITIPSLDQVLSVECLHSALIILTASCMNKQMHDGAYHATANAYGYMFFVYGNIIRVCFSGT